MLFQLTSTFNFTFLVYFRQSLVMYIFEFKARQDKNNFFSFQEYNFPGETL